MLHFLIRICVNIEWLDQLTLGQRISNLKVLWSKFGPLYVFLFPVIGIVVAVHIFSSSRDTLA